MHVSALWIYPVKSLGGIPLETAEVQSRGFRYDRRWMLVDEQGQFLTQRNLPEMALLRPAIFTDFLEVRDSRNPGEPIRTPLQPPATGKFQKVKIWSSEVNAIAPDRLADEWFSDALGFRCRLVFMADSSCRAVDALYGRPGDEVSFADGFPFLVIGQSSLDNLNARLSEALPMNRFRPNIVVEGSQPHEEDAWSLVRMGSAIFRAVKPCIRCTVPTINQETAEPGKEPLRTLATYRQVGNNIYFGENLCLESIEKESAISVGDSVEVLI